jgi:hypothetical protein
VFRGVLFGEKFGSDRAWFERTLVDGTQLIAWVGGDDDGHLVCTEMQVRFSKAARDIGRELAVSELERAIGNSDLHCFKDARTGKRVPVLALSTVPYRGRVRGSRGRPSSWSDTRLAQVVDDLEHDRGEQRHLSRRRVRELANLAETRGIAEPGRMADRRKTWRLTRMGRNLLATTEQ